MSRSLSRTSETYKAENFLAIRQLSDLSSTERNCGAALNIFVRQSDVMRLLAGLSSQVSMVRRCFHVASVATASWSVMLSAPLVNLQATFEKCFEAQSVSLPRHLASHRRLPIRRKRSNVEASSTTAEQWLGQVAVR